MFTALFSVGGAAVAGHVRGAYSERQQTVRLLSKSEGDAEKAKAREDTTRHRIGTQAIENAFSSEREEHAKCRQALEAAGAAVTAANATAASVRVELAECRRDRSYQQRVNEWMRARLDKLDGGSIPPPPLTLDDMETEA